MIKPNLENFITDVMNGTERGENVLRRAVEIKRSEVQRERELLGSGCRLSIDDPRQRYFRLNNLAQVALDPTRLFSGSDETVHFCSALLLDETLKDHNANNQMFDAIEANQRVIDLDSARLIFPELAEVLACGNSICHQPQVLLGTRKISPSLARPDLHVYFAEDGRGVRLPNKTDILNDKSIDFFMDYFKLTRKQLGAPKSKSSAIYMS
jgi:hypothetical protein